jgi:hypothetical protein
VDCLNDRVARAVADGYGVGAVTARRFTVERGNAAVVDLHGGRDGMARI